MKLLLHTCCAPCSIQCVKSLVAEGIKLDLYWYNPNIHPYTEYRSRMDSLREFAKGKSLTLVMQDEYGLRSFIKAVESENSAGPAKAARCAYCYRLRLGKAASMAAEKGCDAFSTTLLISPYQDHELLKQICEEEAVNCGVEFFYRDFRPHFREGRQQAREAGYYMQKYCGCIYSEEERYLEKRGGA